MLKRALVFLFVLPLLALTGWAALVLLFAGPGEAAWIRDTVAAVYALGSVAVLLWVRPFWQAVAAWSVGLIAVLLWWNTRHPSNVGDWQPDVAKHSWGEARGNQLPFHNVRNFDY